MKNKIRICPCRPQNIRGTTLEDGHIGRSHRIFPIRSKSPSDSIFHRKRRLIPHGIPESDWLNNGLNSTLNSTMRWSDTSIALNFSTEKRKAVGGQEHTSFTWWWLHNTAQGDGLFTEVRTRQDHELQQRKTQELLWQRRIPWPRHEIDTVRSAVLQGIHKKLENTSWFQGTH